MKVWADRHPEIEVKPMFGGLCYLVGGNMLGGVKDGNLLLRLGPAGAGHIGKPHILPFPTWARPMAGFLQVEPKGCATEASLAGWLDQAHAFASTLPPKASAAKPATGSAAKKRPATAKPAAKLPAGKRAAAPKRAAKTKPRR
ncbi:MAG: TfoX/Sxy family protein [Myxococcales bacterium]|nr:TfoX/Sxy family protein [Myxococcales bacterium]